MFEETPQASGLAAGVFFWQDLGRLSSQRSFRIFLPRSFPWNATGERAFYCRPPHGNTFTQGSALKRGVSRTPLPRSLSAAGFVSPSRRQLLANAAIASRRWRNKFSLRPTPESQTPGASPWLRSCCTMTQAETREAAHRDKSRMSLWSACARKGDPL